ncbi:MAG: hypothetical protein GC181_07715 [Bacteroidetes bacterium]|nr:hypothetical protein [Bacteroidota bacterium]
MFKTVLSLFFIWVHLIASVGVPVSVHLCNGKIKEVSILTVSKSCCKQRSCDVEVEKHTSALNKIPCCKNIQQEAIRLHSVETRSGKTLNNYSVLHGQKLIKFFSLSGFFVRHCEAFNVALVRRDLIKLHRNFRI